MPVNIRAQNLKSYHYWLDFLYGSVMHRLNLAPGFFAEGWGGAELSHIEKITRDDFSRGLTLAADEMWPPPPIHLEWKKVWEYGNIRLLEANFTTPACSKIKSILPSESHIARVRWLTHNSPSWRSPSACVLHLAGTGDHGFRRRLWLGAPLLKKGITTAVLESPFYGNRKPKGQIGARLKFVSNLLLLGRTTIEEARALLHWFETAAGIPRLGICGLSMGGVHAAMVGSLHPSPIAVIPLLAPHSASSAFCEGMLKHGTAWDALRRDLAKNELNDSNLSIENGWNFGGEDRATALSSLSDVQNSMIRMDAARERMIDILSLTDVSRFPEPKCPSSVIFVSATDDGYVPLHSIQILKEAWNGCDFRWVTGGHVSSILFHRKAFQAAIYDAISKL